MKTIYNTYIVMESQEQCDEIKQICLDYKLEINEDWFSFFKQDICCSCFIYDEDKNQFFINNYYLDEMMYLDTFNTSKQEFIELLKAK